MKTTKSRLLDFVAQELRASEDQLQAFRILLSEYDSTLLGEVDAELKRLRGDANGLKEDFASLEADAAEVVRQWEHGSVGLVDEAVGKLMSNGRPDWWKKPGTWRTR